MKNILITGGSGFIGTNLVDFYVNNFNIINVDINEPRNIEHLKYWRKVDILNYDDLYNVFMDFMPDYVFHLAARTDLDGRNIDEYKANTLGVENVIQCINDTKSVESVVFTSSRLVCEIGYTPRNEFDYKPTTFYGESKVIGEKIVRRSDIKVKWIIVRPTSIWGPWFDVPYRNFFDVIKKGLYFHPNNRKIFKQFGYVGNSVYILDKLIKADINKKTVYLSDFIPIEVGQWSQLISLYFNGGNIRKVPFFSLKVISYFGDILKFIGFKNPPLTTFRLDNLMTEMLYDTENVANIVGELPFDIKSGTEMTVKWMNKYG